MDFSSHNPTTSNALNLAARNNDAQTVKRLLKKMNPNCIDNRGWTCLHEAAAHDSYDCLLLILKHPDVRPLAETHEGHTALYLACRYTSSLETLQALLESEKDIANYGSTESVTPLHIVGSQGRLEVLQMLIDYGAMIDVQDFDGDTPLHDAALAKKAEAVAFLLHAGANPEIKNETYYTPFHLACYKGCYKSVVTLFPFVTNLDQKTLNGDTALILATQGCSDDIIKFLLENGADPQIKNSDGESALDMALCMGYSGVFRTLLYATEKDKINPNIVLLACKPHYCRIEILQEILHYDLGPEFFDFIETFHVHLEQIGGIRPMYYTNAPLNSYLNICEYIYNISQDKFTEFYNLFLMRGVSVNALNVNECPPLVYIHYCMHESCFTEVFKVLQDHGCNVDHCTTASMKAVSLYKKEVIPDAFIASLTADPNTTPVMIPYSLFIEPGDLLQFAFDQGVLCRIPQNVQNQLISMIFNHCDGIKTENLRYHVPPLRHLCRLQFRMFIKNNGVNSTRQFLNIINNLPIPWLLKNYLRYI